MSMKVFSLKKCSLLLLSFLGGLCSCINDDVPTGSSQVAQGDPDGNVVFNLIVPNSGSSLTKSTETSEEYETGLKEEYTVNKVIVYLFDATTGAFRYSFNLSSLSPNGFSSGKQQLVKYQTVRLKVEEEGMYNIYAIANANITKPFVNEAKFLAEIDDKSYRDGVLWSPGQGLIMTTRADNSGYYTNYKGENRNVYLRNLGSNETPKEVNLVLERVLAKIEVGVGREKCLFTLNDSNNNPYADVELTNYYPINLPKKFYLHRHVDKLASFPTKEPEESEFTVENENFGEVKDQNENGYVVDPYFFKKTEKDAANFDNTDEYYAFPLKVPQDWIALQWPKSGNTPEYAQFYCLENCMYKTAQKNAYSTGVHFRAKITPTATRIIGSVNPDTLYYANYTFYDGWNTLSSRINVAGLTGNSDDTALAGRGIKRFIKDDQGKYYCYYNYWIRHLDNNKSNEMGVMEFAVVRNNIYRLNITGISGLGSGSPEIDPGKDDETEVLLNMNINVLPWIIRYQGGDSGVTL